MDWKKNLLLTCLILFVAFLTYVPHLQYSLPYHLDEWDHIGRTIRIQEQGLSYFSNNTLIEIGFDLWLLIIKSLGFPLIEGYQFLPALNIIAICIVLFFFINKKLGYKSGLIAVLLTLAFPTNSNILGIWFYVPIIATIVFDYLALFTLEEIIRDKNIKKIKYLAIYLTIIAFFHQSSFLVIGTVVLISLIYNREILLENKSKLKYFLFILIPIIIMFYHLSDNLTNISKFVSEFIWGPIIPQINYNPFTLFGIIPSIFAIIGFYYTYKKNEMLPFRIYYLISLVSVLFFPIIEISILSAYQRYLYHFMIASIPLAVYGIYYCIKKIESINNISDKIKITLKIIFIIIIGLALIYNLYTTHPQAKLYQIIEKEEVPLIKELSKQSSGNILSPLDIGITIRPLTEKHDELLNFFDWRKTKSLEEFYNANCERKEEIIYNRELSLGRETIANKEKIDYPDYVISNKRQNCIFLKPIHETNILNTYKVNIQNNIKAKLNIPIEFNGTNYKSIWIENKNQGYNISLDFIPYEIEKRQLLMRSPEGDGYYTGWALFIEKGNLILQLGNDYGAKREIITNLNKNTYYKIEIKHLDKFSIKINEIDKTYNHSYKSQKEIYQIWIGGLINNTQGFVGKVNSFTLYG